MLIGRPRVADASVKVIGAPPSVITMSASTDFARRVRVAATEIVILTKPDVRGSVMVSVEPLSVAIGPGVVWPFSVTLRRVKVTGDVELVVAVSTTGLLVREIGFGQVPVSVGSVFWR